MHFAGHAVVKGRNVELACRLLYLCNASPQRNYQIRLTNCNVTKERVHDSQIF